MSEAYGHPWANQGKGAIGRRDRTGSLEITDSAWIGDGALSVTVRAEPGGTEGELIRMMRRLARGASAMPHLTRSSPLVKKWYEDGAFHATFMISRSER